jgi:hypothetical protein
VGGSGRWSGRDFLIRLPNSVSIYWKCSLRVDQKHNCINSVGVRKTVTQQIALKHFQIEPTMYTFFWGK